MTRFATDGLRRCRYRTFGFRTPATLLPDGRVLVVVGIVHRAISRSVLIFDPRKPAWRAGPPTFSPHAQQNALALPDGRV
jgi:hypothetical protein